jgi:hypothetical protein
MNRIFFAMALPIFLLAACASAPLQTSEVLETSEV